MIKGHIKFYGRDKCAPCRILFSMLQKKYKESYEKINVDDDPGAISIAKSLGIKSVPFMILEDGTVLNKVEAFKYLRNL